MVGLVGDAYAFVQNACCGCCFWCRMNILWAFAGRGHKYKKCGPTKSSVRQTAGLGRFLVRCRLYRFEYAEWVKPVMNKLTGWKEKKDWELVKRHTHSHQPYPWRTTNTQVKEKFFPSQSEGPKLEVTVKTGIRERRNCIGEIFLRIFAHKNWPAHHYDRLNENVN